MRLFWNFQPHPAAGKHNMQLTSKLVCCEQVFTCKNMISVVKNQLVKCEFNELQNKLVKFANVIPEVTSCLPLVTQH